ncbi:hypothetical protein EDB83DRAFT_2520461 [Lactarius deliciosus]|nr:hypothetical protein EDB83DRAFT_2520461 [Lactarius deliciosus]
MSFQGLRDSEINEYTGISVPTLKRWRGQYRKTGEMFPPPSIDRGRPCVLTAIQVKFLRDTVDRQPDIALMELQMELREASLVIVFVVDTNAVSTVIVFVIGAGAVEIVFESSTSTLAWW